MNILSEAEIKMVTDMGLDLNDENVIFLLQKVKKNYNDFNEDERQKLLENVRTALPDCSDFFYEHVIMAYFLCKE